MKKKSIVLVVILAFMFLSIFCITSHAVEDVENSEEKQLLISTLDENLSDISNVEMSEDVTASPEYVGDQYLSGKNVTIPEGIYDGNVYLIGEKVVFDGANVKGNVYIMAKDVEFNATSISGSLYAMAATIEASNETSIVDAYVMAQLLKMDATFTSNRSFKAMGTNVQLDGTYTYDVDLMVDDSDIDLTSISIENWGDLLKSRDKVTSDLIIGDNLVIGRNFNYSAKNEVNIPSTASINEIHYSQLKDSPIVELETEKNKAMLVLIQVVMKLINAAFIAIALGWTCKRYRRLNQYHSGIGLFFKSLLKGTLGAVLFLTVALGLVCTIAFLGVGLVGVGYFVYGAYFALAFAANMIAINILGIREESNEGIGYKVAMLGVTLIVALAIWGISLIPYVGGYATIVLAIMGFGGVMDLAFGNAKSVEEKYQKKMSKKYMNAKISPSNEVQTEEPKLDDSDAFNNSSVMIENNEETTKVEEATNPTDSAVKTDATEESKADDIKKDE